MIINADAPKSEKKEEKVRKAEGKTLREVTVKIGLERIDTQEGVIVEALLDSRATGLVMSSEFARKQDFKLKKLDVIRRECGQTLGRVRVRTDIGQ